MKTIKRKIFQWTVIGLSLLCLIFGSLFGAGLRTTEIKATGESNSNGAKNATVTASIMGQNMQGGIAKPSSDNKVYLTVSLDQKPTENVRVYYHTVDRTASASLGDYDAVDSSVLLTTTNYEKVVAITVKLKGYGISKNSSVTTRTFKVVLYRVESDNDIATISSDASSVECSSGCETTLAVQTASSGYDFFSASGYTYTVGTYFSPEINGPYTWYSFFGIGVYSSLPTFWCTYTDLMANNPLWEGFIDLGLSHLAVSAIGSVKDENMFEYPGYCYVGIYRDSKDCNFGTGGGRLNRLIEYAVNNDDQKHGTQVDYTDYIKSIEYGSDKETNIISSYGNYAIMGEVSSDDVYYLGIQNRDNSNDDWFNLKLSFQIVDYEAPTVVGYSIQSDVKEGEKIGLTMRLSEPVQTKSSNYPKISGYVNGMITNSISFDYVAGFGTDTLYFEADVPSLNTQINSIQLNDFSNFGYISDYSSHCFVYNTATSSYSYQNDNSGNMMDKPDNSTVACSIDIREPEITTTSVVSSLATRRAEAVLRFSNVGDGARLLYSWTDSEDDPSVYDYTVSDIGSSYTIVGSNMNGKKWLKAKLVSAYGKEGSLSKGYYLFDSLPPTITTTLESTSSLTQKDFSVSVTDGEEGLCAGVESVYMLVSANADGSDATERLLRGASETATTFSITASDVGLGVNEYGTFYIAFYAVDNAGNQTAEGDIVYTAYRFDTREYFESEFVQVVDSGTNTGSLLLEITSDGAYVVDCTKQPAIYIYCSISSAQVKEFVRADGSSVAYDLNSGLVNGRECRRIRVSDYDAGYAELYLYANDGGTEKVSETYRFYFTKNWQEDTSHYKKAESGILLLNEVYQLSASVQYKYKNKEGDVVGENYGGTSLAASFSSSTEAKSYVYYMELQDLYAETLTESQANDLNGGITTNWQKARNETTTAQKGQTWIRYKSSTWEQSSTSNSWVWYYYSPSQVSKIDTGRLSNNLIDALNNVADRIVGYGNTTYLVGEDNVNSLGEPYLDPAQIHAETESVTTSKVGTIYSNAVTYAGDSAIYSSQTTINGMSYPIATNLPLVFTDYTKLYYKKNEDNTYNEIASGSATYLSEIIHTTGIYQIKELDESGCRIFSVYVDVNAPILTVSWVDSNGVTQRANLDEGNSNNTYNASSFTLVSISDEEKDVYSYVAIYRYSTSTTGTLLYVITKEQLSDYQLDTGNYHVVVSDRSGNSYSFVLRVNSTGLVCNVNEVADSYIRVTCNREDDQIAAYEITCNGTLITATYSASANYTQSGYYEIYIRDIYGNEYNKTILFERSLPTITWRYNSDGSYVTYNAETTTAMKISQSGEKTYIITTSALLQFTFSGDYSYSSNITWTENPVSLTKTMTELSSFELTVWYTNYPEVSATYICAIDTTPPTITVRQNAATYSVAEMQEILDQIASGNIGDTLTMSTIGYVQDNSSDLLVDSGASIYSRFIRVGATDTNGVSYIEIYLDGNLYLRETSNFTGIVLSRYGSYTIKACDIFGNVATFTFTNNKKQLLDYTVDGVAQDTDYSCLDYFTGDNYTKIEYGKVSTIIKLYKDSEIAYKIYNGTNTIITVLSVENGNIYIQTYKIVMGDTEKTAETVKSDSLLSQSDTTKNKNTWYEILSASDAGVTIYASFDSNGYYSFRILADESGETTYKVEARVWFSTDEEPFYLAVKLYTGKTNVKLISDGNEITTNINETPIKTNKAFTVSSDCATDEDVASVKVYYSTNGVYKNYVTVYDGTYYDKTFEKDGMYLVEIVNSYGTTTKYYLILSDDFVVTVKIEYTDGESVSYSVKYEGALNSNNSVEITAYASDVTIVVTKDGITYSGMIITRGEETAVVKIEEEGNYVITLTDTFGNIYEREVHIIVNSLSLDDGLIYGYNDNALRKDEGYTNNKLSISEEKLADSGLVYILVEYGDESTILYNLIAEEKVVLDTSKLLQCIGKSGDGVYTIIFRDAYGNRIVKEIHYCGASTLTLTRTTRSSVAKEEMSIETAISIGLWSNNALYFTTTAEEYIFTVDGRRVSLDYNLQFGSGADEGSFIYEITYVDEYGFSYSFTAHLFRQNIELTLVNTDTTDIEGITTVKSGVAVTFGDNVTCVYNLNSADAVAYTKGTTLAKDGTYRFTATDYAGNVAVLTVKKDTAVEFSFTETSTSVVLVSGAVACTNRVVFNAINGDTAKIEKVYLDGVLQSNYTDTTFTDNGKWEMVIADSVGNRAYFMFYIITHSIKSFSYTTPYNYQINELWYDSGDGKKISYMDFVRENGKACTFSENGTYSVVMSSTVTGDVMNFSITINNIAPAVSLVNANSTTDKIDEGTTTLNDVTISGCKEGDTITVYKNDKLVTTLKVTASSENKPITISEGGNYKIVVCNEAGVDTTLTFTRKHIPNTAGNVLIFVVLFAFVVIIIIGLIYRNRSKTDD